MYTVEPDLEATMSKPRRIFLPKMPNIPSDVIVLAFICIFMKGWTLSRTGNLLYINPRTLHGWLNHSNKKISHLIKQKGLGDYKSITPELVNRLFPPFEKKKLIDTAMDHILTVKAVLEKRESCFS